MRALALLSLLALAACGADGAPTKPAPKPAAAASMRVAPTSMAARLLATPIARLWWP